MVLGTPDTDTTFYLNIAKFYGRLDPVLIRSYEKVLIRIPIAIHH
jgi:hypothetical protein